jgi:hypothetical protein
VKEAQLSLFLVKNIDSLSLLLFVKFGGYSAKCKKASEITEDEVEQEVNVCQCSFELQWIQAVEPRLTYEQRSAIDGSS